MVTFHVFSMRNNEAVREAFCHRCCITVLSILYSKRWRMNTCSCVLDPSILAHQLALMTFLLISKSIFELQSMLLVQEHFANCERYLISETKSKLMSVNSKKHSINETVMLHDAPLEQVDSYMYTHIGIQRD